MQPLLTDASRGQRARGGGRTRRRARQERQGSRPRRLLGRLSGRAMALARSPLLAILPLGALLLLSEMSFVVLVSPLEAEEYLFFSDKPTAFVDSRLEAAEALRRQLQAALYLCVAALGFVHRRSILALLGAYPHLVAILAWCLAGALYSLDPFKVVTNTVLLTVALLIAALHAIGSERHDRFRPFYLSMLLPMLFVHLVSVALLVVYPVDVMAYFGGAQRYGGLAGNPNSLGGSAVLGIWAAASLLADRTTPRRLRWLSMGSIAVFVPNIALSGSGTSTVVALLVILALVYMRTLASIASRWRPLLNFGAAGAAGVAVIGIFLWTSPAELLEVSAGSLGKDSTLTGRTELWEIAAHAVEQRPVTGYSLDSHFSVKEDPRFEIDHNHYHNGFLDTWVAGGAVLLLLALYNMGRFGAEFLRAFREDPRAFPLILGLMILVMLNLSEYSLLRPLAQTWQVYLVAFVATVWPTVMRRRQRRRRPTGKASRAARDEGRASTGPALSW